ncbi:hypothetical protein D1007_35807 [Hordeum vulgare]|nr:hypothetical protein D1007_35807 [Hordeum vulgare]
MDPCRPRRKNAELLRLTIEQSEPGANKEAAVIVAHHAKEQDRLLHRVSGMRCSSDQMDDFNSSSDDVASPHADTYMKEGHNLIDDRKGKGLARKW